MKPAGSIAGSFDFAQDDSAVQEQKAGEAGAVNLIG